MYDQDRIRLDNYLKRAITDLTVAQLWDYESLLRRHAYELYKAREERKNEPSTDNR